jgi:hypothetical protein
MLDLIAKLESATEGSRELDREVNLAATGKFLHHLAPRYTTSIDAALTLVPGYHYWIVGVQYAAVWQEDGRLADAEKIVTHGRPALALCIAALKARSVG